MKADRCKERVGMKKKIVLINANCHGRVLAEFLKLSKSFDEYYEIVPVPEIQLNIEKRIAPELLRRADVFIHQVIRSNNSIAYELSDEATSAQLSGGVLDITIPNLVGFGKWIYPNLGSIIMDENGNNLVFQDEILEKAYMYVTDKKDLDAYVAFLNEYEMNVDLREIKEKEMQKLREREVLWDVKIVDFIQEYYQTIPMFVDAGHPTKRLMYEVGCQVLKLLEIKNDVDFDEFFKILGMGMPTPISRKIQQFWGLRYQIPMEARKSFIFPQIEKISEELYVRQYVAEYFFHTRKMVFSADLNNDFEN